MKVSFNGFNEKAVTFETASAIAVGKCVKMSANGKVAACEADDNFIGVVINSESDAATVQLSGYVKVAYSGTAPTVGYNKLSSDANSKVCVDATDGREHLILDVDTTASTAGIIL